MFKACNTMRKFVMLLNKHEFCVFRKMCCKIFEIAILIERKMSSGFSSI